ncbi:MAG: DNA polymerase III subunit delta [Lachnospiraceae bacterium]|nr:DNA polymerase III subunit delta [Lachnospiraceae bacterium]
MAEKKSGKKDEPFVDWVAEDIKSGEFKNIYLLYGTESYMLNWSRSRLIKALIPEADDMNYSVYEDKSLDLEKIIDQADTMPFFADRRVLLIKDSGYFKNANERLKKYLPQLPPTTVMVFCEKEVRKGKGTIFDYVNTNGRVVEYTTLDRKDIERNVVALLRREGRTMQRPTFEYFIDRVGLQMQDISIELEKLVCYTEGREMISREDIDAVVSPRLEEHVFDLTNAIAEKKRRTALEKYYELMSLKTQPMGIIVLLTRQFNRLMLIKSMRSKGLGADRIAKSLGISERAVPVNERLASRFTMEELKSALADCVDAEEAVKSGRMSDTLSLETLIVKYASN